MKMTGELLKAERLKQDLKIPDVAFALKIGNKTLQAIESGDLESLPAKTFVRGFVKSYAEFLKLDSNLVMKQFQEEMGSTNPMPKMPPQISAHDGSHELNPQKSPLEKKRKAHDEKTVSGLNQKHIYSIAAVGLLVAAIAFVNHSIKKYSKERVEVRPSDAGASVTSKISSSDQQASSLLAMTQTVPASSDASEAAAKTVEETAVAEVKAEAEEKNNETAALDKSKEKPVEVLIEAKKNVVIEYAKGNTTQFEKILIKENTYQIIRSQKGLHLRTDDSSQIVLTVNGVIQTIDKSKKLQLSF